MGPPSSPRGSARNDLEESRVFSSIMTGATVHGILDPFRTGFGRALSRHSKVLPLPDRFVVVMEHVTPEPAGSFACQIHISSQRHSTLRFLLDLHQHGIPTVEHVVVLAEHRVTPSVNSHALNCHAPEETKAQQVEPERDAEREPVCRRHEVYRPRNASTR